MRACHICYKTICVASVSQFITRASLPDNQYSLLSAHRGAQRAEASGGHNEEIMKANGGKTEEKRTNDLETSGGGRRSSTAFASKIPLWDQILVLIPAESKAVLTDQWWEEPSRAEDRCPDNRTEQTALRQLGF